MLEQHARAAVQRGAFDVVVAGDVGTGALLLARRLRREGLRVGLAGIAVDVPELRTGLAAATADRVDVAGVNVVPMDSALHVVDGRATTDAREVPLSALEQQGRRDLAGVSIPSAWSAALLLLSGVSPSVAASASFCRAARNARRAGSVVLLDLNVRWKLWRGADARLARMALHEADAVWCTAEDLFGMNLPLADLRAALRPDAVLVTLDGEGRLSASGPFGVVQPNLAPLPPVGDAGRFTAALALGLAKRGRPMLLDAEPWIDALRRAHTIASARP